MMTQFCNSCGERVTTQDHACPGPTAAKQTSSCMNREEKIRRITAYLMMKVEEHDWHAVSDAANDIRVLEGR